MRTRNRGPATAATTALVLAAGIAAAGSASAGVTGPAFYVDGQAYRTVATPTDLAATGAPAHSFDRIYDLGGAQMNVATAAPGDRDYNGGRWRVHALTFPAGYAAAVAAGDLDDDGVLDSDAEIMAAVAAGAAVDAGVVRSFVCPVIPLPRAGA
ncbi:hypothetical protein Q9R32_09310 [Actinotalea sp. AC32]|nr:hypothetical protein [Actinotalea sp. AC32]